MIRSSELHESIVSALVKLGLNYENISDHSETQLEIGIYYDDKQIKLIFSSYLLLQGRPDIVDVMKPINTENVNTLETNLVSNHFLWAQYIYSISVK